MPVNTPRFNKVSIIIPAFKEEKKIVHSITCVENILKDLPYDYQIIVVVDGIVDKTLEKLLDLKSPKLKIESYKRNFGKGYAVRLGVEKADGDIIGFIDAGMDIDPGAIPLLIEYMKLKNADIVIGSKLHPDSKINLPKLRKMLSWGYRGLSHFLFGFNIKDSQVGLKIFRKKVAKDIFPRLIVNRFAFDIEALAVAYSLGYRNIVEAPIKLNFNNLSTISSSNFWIISLNTLYDTVCVFYRLRIGYYYDKIHQS